MELTNDQITYIDDYLKHHKLIYWDIRMELLDHIVNTVETKIEQGISFDDAMIEVHQNFGNSMKMFWNTGVEYSIFANGEGYKQVVAKKRKETNKKYRKLYFQAFLNLFKSIKSLASIFLLVFFEYVLFHSVSDVVFKRINIFMLLVPVAVLVYINIQQSIKKNKSINLEYSGFYATFSFLLLSTFINLGNNFDFVKDSSSNKNILIAIIVILNILFTYGGFKIYQSSIKKYNDMYEKLKETCS
jgi:hypothetical protein